MNEQEMLSQLLNALLSSSSAKSSDENNQARSGEEASDTAAAGLDGLLGGIDIDSIMNIMNILSQMNKPDKNSALLLALKPHLRPENRKKVDTALSLMKIMSILPLLKESGLMNDIF